MQSVGWLQAAPGNNRDGVCPAPALLPTALGDGTRRIILGSRLPAPAFGASNRQICQPDKAAPLRGAGCHTFVPAFPISEDEDDDENENDYRRANTLSELLE